MDTMPGPIDWDNKADKDGAQQTRADLQDSLSLMHSPVPIQIFDTIAVKQDGVESLWQGIKDYLKDAQAVGLIEQKLLSRRRRLLMRILQRDFDDRISAYWRSDRGGNQVLSTLAGDLTIEALRNDLFAHMTKLD